MLTVEIENAERLFHFLSKPTTYKPVAGSKRRPATSILGKIPLVFPMEEISIHVMSSGVDMELYASIQGGRISPDKIPKRFSLSLPHPLVAPKGLKYTRINEGSIQVTDEDGVEKFYIYAPSNGSPIKISAGLRGFPSGPVVQIDTVENLENTFHIFKQIIESVVNVIYESELKQAIESRNINENLGKKEETGLWQIYIGYLERAKKLNNTLYIRASTSSAKEFDDHKGDEDEDEGTPNPISQRDRENVGKIWEKLEPDEIEFGIDDVKGVEGQKERIWDIVDFIQNPNKYRRMGSRLPKGVLLKGPPGTGKTMLAKAIAKKADVPCLIVSGSSFVESLVGRGAARVRDVFAQITELMKEIGWGILIFDEIDAVAGKRTEGSGGAQEYNQTLSALLYSLQNFKNGVLVATTNRPDVLDPALTRGGRIGIHLEFPRPHAQAREEIILMHIEKRGIRVEEGIDYRKFALRARGLSGGDLEEVINSATLLAVRREKNKTGVKELFDELDNHRLGPETHLPRTPEELRKTAVHETGHVLIFEDLYPLTDRVHLVTIRSRAGMLGLTVALPDATRYGLTRQQILAGVCVDLGGRAAGIIKYGEDNIGTGARKDIEMASEDLRNMIMEYGMYDELGAVFYGKTTGDYLGNKTRSGAPISQRTLELIDEIVRKEIKKQLDRAIKILRKHEGAFNSLVEELLEHKTLDGEDVQRIIKENPPDTIESPTAQIESEE